MKKLLCAAIIIGLAALPAAQTVLTGKWQGKTGGSGQTVILDATVKGATLTGTLTVNNETSEIADGKVSKNVFTFKATVEGRENETFSGEVGDDQVRLWPDSLGRDRAVVMTRVGAK